MSFDKINDLRKLTFLAILFGFIISLGVTLTMLFLFSFVYCYIDVKEWLGAVFALISLVFGAYFGARYTVGKLGQNGFMYGITVGFALFLFVFTFSLFLGDGKYSLTSLFNLICCVLSGGISGIIRVNKELNKKYLK